MEHTDHSVTMSLASSEAAELLITEVQSMDAWIIFYTWYANERISHSFLFPICILFSYLYSVSYLYLYLFT